ncbi:MAG: hypothetical protein KJ964_11390, partial [Verrucomicrobia bacterium]|nr:hypothetical protein [Verrucomicrobiota bacterium]MBU1734388.1 hypothetical protein [Verrucomicrobiota bacterium]
MELNQLFTTDDTDREDKNIFFDRICEISVGNVVSWVQKRVEKMEPREHRIRPVGESENTHWGDTGDARGLQ